MQSNQSRIFICYAQKDNENNDPSRRWLDRLLEHLQALELQEKASIWSDRNIEVGDNWNDEIQNTLQEVEAAILLISSAFLGSRYIRNSEIPVLLQNALNKGVKIFPIILWRCLFNETKFKYPDRQNGLEELSLSIFQAANSPSEPLNSMEEHKQDEIFLSVARRILKIVARKEEKIQTVSLQDSLEGEQTRTYPTNKIIYSEGIDYSELAALLKQAYQSNDKNCWRDADYKTYLLMLEAVKKGKLDYAKKKDMLKFPCQDLEILDNLWTKYSDGKFGFTSQNEIWIDSRDNYFSPVGKNFATRVGWLNIDRSYKRRDDLNFDLNSAPKGHLPCTLRFTGRLDDRYEYWLFSYISSRLKTCSTNTT